MSVRMMSLVWAADSSLLKGSARLLMLAIADNANDEGHCFPGMAKLAEKTGVSRRQVIRLITLLEKEGYIRVDRSSNKVNHYYIQREKLAAGSDNLSPQDETASDTMSPQAQSGSDNLSPGSDTGDTRGVTPCHPGSDIDVTRTVINHQGTVMNRGRRARAGIPPPQTEEESAIVAHTAVQAWLDAGFQWPGYDTAPEIVRRLGDQPDVDLLVQAKRFWRMSGYKDNNLLGILDWYAELRDDPNWSPGPARSNGRAPAKPKEPAPAAW